MNVDDIRKIIKNRRIELGLTMAEVAKAVGVSEATVSRWESGNISNMKRSRIASLSKVLQIPPTVIMGYDASILDSILLSILEYYQERGMSEEEMIYAFANYRNAEMIDRENEYKQLTNIIPLRTKRVPLLGEIAAGKPTYADEHFEYYVEVEDVIKADFCIKVKGDSMINARIFDGDIVFIREQPDVEDGEIAAVRIDDEATLKRVYKMPGRIQLRAENPAYEPINITEEEGKDIEILGKAIAFQSKVK